MKSIFLISLALCTSLTNFRLDPSNYALNESPSNYICGPLGMQFYPEAAEISPTSLFIIDGYALSQKEVEKLKDEKIYLQSESGDLVELLLLEMHKGKKERTQAVLKPSRLLQSNERYQLVSENRIESNNQKINDQDYIKFHRKQPTWTVINTTSSKATSLPLNIRLTKSEYMLFGCGPSIHTFFKVQNPPTFEIWYKTEFVNLTTNESTIYYLKDIEGKLRVGHGMCSGAFSYPNHGMYKVRFTPMTTDGSSFPTTDWMTFKRPSLESQADIQNED